MQKEFDGRDLKLIKVLDRYSSYTKYYITYKSGELTISGIMNVPKGKGPYPVIITAHGFIRPEYYVTGRGLKREQDYLAKHGYVVLHPDYRNHAGSDQDPDNDLKLHIGYIEDVINAVYAIKNSPLSYLDKENIGMLGHSLGGGLALGVMVTKPDLVRAYVLFAPMSMDYRDNFYRWTMRSQRPDRGHRETALKIIEKYGSPEANPEFWDNLSPQTFLDRVRSPVMVHHGTADDSVPLEWSEKLAKVFQEHHKEIIFYIYEGEKHEFIKQWPLVMKRTLGFFDSLLKT
jgi:dipeptidyl aminopeptidase/acylaminoacyl peptidase